VNSEAVWLLSSIGVLVVALIPAVLLHWLTARESARRLKRINQLERVVDQCAGIIKPMARKSALVNANTVMSRHQRESDEELQAAARAIDVVAARAGDVVREAQP